MDNDNKLKVKFLRPWGRQISFDADTEVEVIEVGKDHVKLRVFGGDSPYILLPLSLLGHTFSLYGSVDAFKAVDQPAPGTDNVRQRVDLRSPEELRSANERLEEDCATLAATVRNLQGIMAAQTEVMRVNDAQYTKLSEKLGKKEDEVRELQRVRVEVAARASTRIGELHVELTKYKETVTHLERQQAGIRTSEPIGLRITRFDPATGVHGPEQTLVIGGVP